MTTHLLDRGPIMRVHSPATALVHLAWLAAGLVAGFGVPFVFADTLELPRDIYYGIYIAFVVVFFALWARATGQSLAALVRRRWLLSLGLAVGASTLLAAIVLGKDATPRPDGIELVAAVLWRGVAYGLADGLFLSAFPVLVVFAVFEGTRLRKQLLGTIAVGFAALAASMAMTATYHAGYSEFRSEKVGQPIAGDAIWSAPTLLTLNPIGAPVAHAGMHVTAVLHSYETDLFLPPHQ
jgi:hypothetical protein